MPRLVTSAANPAIKAIRALEMRKKRRETGLFVAEGLRTVLEGIEHGAILETIVFSGAVATRSDVLRAIAYCENAGGEALEVADDALGKISHKDNPQSVIGVFRQNPLPLTAVEPRGIWILLENIRDPGNLGTIIRTADAVGASGVILAGQCCDPYSFEATRATMGSIFSVPIVQADATTFFNWHPTWTGETIGTALQDSVDYREADYRLPLLLAMGNEQQGLSPEMRGLCTRLVRLPMKGRADSLNLAVATGVMLYAVESAVAVPEP